MPLIVEQNKAFLPLASCHHYCSMMKQHQKKVKRDEKVKLKVYLYTLRPLLAAMWVMKNNTQPPMLFSELVEEYLRSGPIREIIDKLIKIKSDSSESDIVNRMPILDDYMATEIQKVEAKLPAPAESISEAECNEALRLFINICWNKG